MGSMTIAYIMVKTAPGKEKEVLNKLKATLKTKEIFVVYGLYDIIIRMRAKSNDALYRITNQKIRTLTDVVATITLPVLDLPEEDMDMLHPHIEE